MYINIIVPRGDELDQLLYKLADQIVEGFRFLKPYYDYMLSLAGDPAPEGRA